MKIIVSVQAKRGSSRGLVHYIANSKIDPQKEGHRRQLFSRDADSLSVREANELLKKDLTKKRPENSELHHLVISLKPEDFQRLGRRESERTESLKKIARAALETLEKEIKADALHWTAAIHRNTDNPHVHIAVQKQFFDRDLKKRTLQKIPRSCLPQYEKKEGEREFVPGLMIASAAKKLEEIAAEKSKVISECRIEDKTKGKPADRTKHQGVKFEDMMEENPSPEIKRVRDLLARAILTKFFYEKAEDKRNSTLTNGDKRRFLIFDNLTNRKRRMSLFDLERRSRQRADRKIRDKKIKDPEQKDILRTQVFAAEMARSRPAAEQIESALQLFLDKETKELEIRKKEFLKTENRAEKIHKIYRQKNWKLPLPALKNYEIEMLQTYGLEKGDLRSVRYLERVRSELVSGKEIPPRSLDEIGKLKALKIVSELKIRYGEKLIKDFPQMSAHFAFEIDGEKWSLQRADLRYRKHFAGEQKLIGKTRKLFEKTGVLPENSSSKKLAEIKELIIEKLDEKKSDLASSLAREKSVYKTLEKIISSEVKTALENPEPKFSARQLAEIESLSLKLKSANLYRQNFAEQKKFLRDSLVSVIEPGENPHLAGEPSRSGKIENFLAGRTVARAILCEIELARAKEDLKHFRQTKRYQKFEIPGENASGHSKFVSLWEVEFKGRGSLFDQALDLLTEPREQRRTRNMIENLLREKSIELRAELKSAKELFRIASEEAKEFSQKTFFGKVQFKVPPVFTPRELIDIEIRAQETRSRSEARTLRHLLECQDHTRAKNLESILKDLSNITPRRNNPDRVLEEASRSERPAQIEGHSTKTDSGRTNPRTVPDR
jgi:hypothetical protein